MSSEKSYLKQHHSPTLPPQKPKHKPQKGLFHKGLLIGVALTGVAMLSATAGALIAVSVATAPLRQSQLTETQQAVFNQDEAIAYQSLRLPQLSRPLNILVLGTKVLTSDVNDQSQADLGYHALVDSFEGLSDTMLLVRVDPVKDKITVLSIPRDTKTVIKNYGYGKINTANSLGGPALAAETMSSLLNDVPIDRYVRINVQGVEKLIDILGGVNVYVPNDMKYTDHSQHLYIDLKQGQQHLDGEKALEFLRFRHDELGDIGRVQRQQMLMRALVEQSLKPQVILKLPEILSIIQSHIDTNLTVEELLALTGLAGQSKRENIQMLMLPGVFGEGEGNYSYWLPSTSQINTMMAQHFDQGYVDQFAEQDSTHLSIAIQDTTDDPEAVDTMIRYLQEKGYRNVYVTKHWPEKLTTTRIVAQKGDEIGASEVRVALNVGEILVESTGNIASDITIQMGQDWRLEMLNLKDLENP